MATSRPLATSEASAAGPTGAAEAWALISSRADRLSPGINDADHSLIFMVENVAVIDGAAGEVLEGDAHLDVAACGDVNHVCEEVRELLAVPSISWIAKTWRWIGWSIGDEVVDDPFFDRPDCHVPVDPVGVEFLPSMIKPMVPPPMAMANQLAPVSD